MHLKKTSFRDSILSEIILNNRSMRRASLSGHNGLPIIKECNINITLSECRDHLEEMINKEREDRIKYHDDHLNPIRAQVKSI
jgi:hypothetical protein